MKRYETPDALRHDAQTLVDDAHALIDATSEYTDEKVTQARERLQSALDTGKRTYRSISKQVVNGAKVADAAVHAHPYRGMAAALGVGVVIGYLIKGRKA